MTNIYSLPQITTLTFSVSNNADWLDGLQFNLPNSGPALDLTGIYFHATLRPSAAANTTFNPVVTLDMDTINGLLINQGVTGILQWNINAKTMNTIAAGSYVMDIIAKAEIEVNLMEGSPPATVTVIQGITLP